MTSVAANFQRRIDDLMAHGARWFNALSGTSNTKWMAGEIASGRNIPAEDVGDLPTVPSPIDEIATEAAFDASELDGVIDNLYTDPEAKTVDSVSSQLQVNYLAAMKRDFCLRMRPRLRLMAHESARRQVHGDARGPIGSGPLLKVIQVNQQAAVAEEASE